MRLKHHVEGTIMKKIVRVAPKEVRDAKTSKNGDAAPPKPVRLGGGNSQFPARSTPPFLWKP